MIRWQYFDEANDVWALEGAQCLSYGGSTPGMHAPPRPAPAPGEMAAPGRPGPENFQLCPAPPRPTPEKEGAAPPRPAPKITPGQESWQTFLHHQKFLGVKNFWPVFLAPKALFEDMWPTITIPISPNDS